MKCKYCGSELREVTKNYISINDLEDWEVESYCEHCGSEQVNGEWYVGDTDIIQDKVKQVIEQVNETYKYQDVVLNRATKDGLYYTINNPSFLAEEDFISYTDLDITTLAEDYLISEVE